MNPSFRPLHGPQGDQPGDVLQAGDEWSNAFREWEAVPERMHGMKILGTLCSYRRPPPPCRHEGPPVVPAHGDGEKCICQLRPHPQHTGHVLFRELNCPIHGARKTTPSLANDAKAGTETPETDELWRNITPALLVLIPTGHASDMLRGIYGKMCEIERRAIAAEAKLVAVEKDRDEAQASTNYWNEQFEQAKDRLEDTKDLWNEDHQKLRLATERVRALEEGLRSVSFEMNGIMMYANNAPTVSARKDGWNLKDKEMQAERANRLMIWQKADTIKNSTDALLSTPAKATGKEESK